MKDRDTPLRLVRLWEKKIPGVYDTLDGLKAINGSAGIRWPDFCDLPISAAFVILLCCGLPCDIAGRIAAELTACYTWRKTKVIYSFNEDLSYMLAAQADDFMYTDILPADVLVHPPYPCTFVKTDVFNGAVGFWYWIEYDMNRDGIELRVQFVERGMNNSVPFVLHLLPGETIQECWDDTLAECRRNVMLDIVEDSLIFNEQDLHDLLVALQFILYLVSENADIQDVPRSQSTQVRKKRDQILDKASEVKEKAVGVRIGNAIRKSRQPSHSSSQNGTGSKVRPHSRRGHWHHYWTGPRDGDRKLILKWTAPTFVHLNDFRNDEVVIYPIKREDPAS